MTGIICGATIDHKAKDMMVEWPPTKWYRKRLAKDLAHVESKRKKSNKRLT